MGYGGTFEQWCKYQRDARSRALKHSRRRIDPTEPITTWKEIDSLEGKNVQAMVAILNTPGCTWARGIGCLMCGYTNDVHVQELTTDQLKLQIEVVAGRSAGMKIIKLFDSGSFLDPNEAGSEPWSALEPLAELEELGLVIIESRPNFMDKGSLLKCKEALGDIKLDVAIGLESASETILYGCINKGFTFEDYKKAAETAKEVGVGVKTYLLLKPPFVTEWGAVEDCSRSVDLLLDTGLTQTISINPVNVQNFTAVEALYERGAYRSPWLWSVLEVLRRNADKANEKGVRLMSSPTAGGKTRGAHNCGTCDLKLLEIIEVYSLDNDPGLLDVPDCGCKGEWDMLMQLRDRAWE